MRYLVFYGDAFYARGGANDGLAAFAALSAAQDWVEVKLGYEDWWHIFDTHKLEILFKSPEQAYGVYND